MAEHETDDLEVVGSKLHCAQFWTKFMLFCVTLDLSDNLTERYIVKNSNGKTYDLFTLHGNGTRTDTVNWTTTQETIGPGSFPFLGPLSKFLYSTLGPIGTGPVPVHCA